ncbi:hypothetical protein L604_001100000350 [Bacillus subtilis J27]|nr:hypothetical protein L604_001100000350 [Bacillus subtilis J27]
MDHELPNGDLKASEIVSAHKEEIDSILSGISDIIDLDMYTLDEYADKMGDAQKVRRDTITAVDKLDESLTTEYQNLESLDNAVLTKYSVLMQATSNGKSASPMYYDKKAFHSNEVYKSVIEVENQGTTYIDAKSQQAEARRLQEKAEEEANKPWYEKTWDGVCNFTGEVTGYYDYKRATEGVDPVTGEKLSTAERVTAGAMAAAGFIPVVGWAGRAFKGGKAIYKTGKAAIAAEHALDAYKTGKSLDILKMTEMGAYGLVASNGFSEAVTGRDMFGNKVSEEKRKTGALEAALSLVGAGALAKSVDNTLSMGRNLDKSYSFSKIKQSGHINKEQIVTSTGHTFDLKPEKKQLYTKKVNNDKLQSSKKSVDPVEQSVSYYRVQGGGAGNKTSQYRIKVNSDGSIAIPIKNADLNISAYNLEHAKYYRDVARPGGEIVEFKVPKEIDDLIKETVIDQYGYTKNPRNQGRTAPKLVDPTTPGVSYELPAEPWIEWLEEYGHSAKKIE